MRKIVSFCLAIILCAGLLPAGQALSAQSAAVIDADTGQALFLHNADARMPMASTTKIMTAIAAIENYDLDRTYTVKKEYTLVEGSSMYLKEGEEITLRETLYGLMLMSGNDAALAVAGECGGLEEFVELMNRTAINIGLTDTHFDNPNGLDGETHYTTARELAMLAAYAMQNEAFREIVGTINYSEGGRHMHNHNKLLTMYDDAVGVKTGFTKKSGRCLVSAAERNGRTLIAVTLHASDDWNDHMAMLEAGFANYQMYTLHQAGDTVRTQPIMGGGASQIEIKTDSTLQAFLTREEYDKMSAVVKGSTFTYAPVQSGSVYGSIEYKIGDAVLAEDTLRFSQGAVLLPERRNLPEKLMDKMIALLP